MASCLGIFVENNLIKYAKISKSGEKYSVEAFGVKFSDNLDQTFNEIVEETGSKNVEIYTNLTGEMYNYFSVFSMLKKKDIENLLHSEVELLSAEKGINFNVLDSRYVLVNDLFNKEKQTAIYISADKTEITAKMQKLMNFNVSNLVPMPIAMLNLMGTERENYAIVNIEGDTSVSIVVGNEISKVIQLPIGMEDILKSINARENSIQKSYEICKNTTIFTMETNDAQTMDAGYLQDIMPVLYKIADLIKANFEENVIDVRKIILAGSGALINNIELYFQEILAGYKIELMVPAFLDRKSNKINVKDYMEVNSAIALAVHSLSGQYSQVNFKNTYMKKPMTTKGLLQTLNSDFDMKNFSLGSIGMPKLSLRGEFDTADLMLMRLGVVGTLGIVLFSGGALKINEMITEKTAEVDLVINDLNQELSVINSNTSEVKSKKSDYTTWISNLEALSSETGISNKYKKAIPTLMNQIMAIIPQQVRLTSIQNTVDGNIIIQAESTDYEGLAYFKAKLKNENILINIESDAGTKESEVIKTTIRGEL